MRQTALKEQTTGYIINLGFHLLRWFVISFGEEYRPVKLATIVLGMFPFSFKPFTFDQCSLDNCLKFFRFLCCSLL